MVIDSLICGSDLMRSKGYSASNRGRTRLNGRLRLDRGGAAAALSVSAAAPWPASPERARQ
jgi:hypothetical protein